MQTLPFPRRGVYRALQAALIAGATSASFSAPMHAQSLQLEEIIVTAQRREESIQDTPIAVTALGAAEISAMGVDATEDLVYLSPTLSGYAPPTDKGGFSLSIRGIGNGSPALYNDPANAVYVDGIYIGKSVGSSVDVLDIERVEILRGPQGTLFGRNAVGGAINFVTAKPTGELGGQVSATLGNYDLRKLRATVDLPAIGTEGEGLGAFMAKIDTSMETRDPLYDDTSGINDGFDDRDRNATRLTVRWAPTETVRADYSYERSNLEEQPVAQQLLYVDGIYSNAGTTLGMLTAGFAPTNDPTQAAYLINGSFGMDSLVKSGRQDEIGADLKNLQDIEVTGHTLAIGWDISEDLEFKAISGFREMDTEDYGDSDGFNSNDLTYNLRAISLANPAVVIPLAAPNTNILPFWATGKTQHYEQFSQEFQLTGFAFNERVEFTSGLFYFSEKADRQDNRQFFQGLNALGSNVSENGASQNYEFDNEAWAAYGQATWTPPVLEDRMRLTVGLRYTQEHKETTWDFRAQAYDLDGNGSAGGIPLGLPAGIPLSATSTLLGGAGSVSDPYLLSVAGLTGKTDDENFYNFGYFFNIAYDLSNDINTYFTVATGYRSGGFNGEATNAAATKPFEEEHLLSLELGLKATLMDGRLRVNSALWQSNYKDLQVSGSTVTPTGILTIIDNAGEANRWGLEVETAFVVSESLTAQLAWAHSKGEFKEFPVTAAATTICNLPLGAEGKDCAKTGAAPDDSITASLIWNAGSLMGLGNLSARIDAAYQSETQPQAYYDENRGGLMESRTLTNARLTWSELELGSGTVSASLWVKNLTDEEYVDYIIPFNSGPIGQFNSGRYGDPRTYGLDLSYNF